MTTQQREAIQGILDADYVIEAIQDNFEPEDVFSDKALTAWAENNGFKKSDE